MEHKWNISRRKRGLLGALIGAAIPIGLGMYEHGSPFQWSGDIWLIISGFAMFLAFVFGSVAMSTSSFQHRKAYGSEFEDGSVWPEQDRDDFISQTGIYTSLRYSWDPNYQRNSWD